jgi:hypothetical protein
LPILFAESYPLEDWLELVSSSLDQAKSLYLIFSATKQQRPSAHISDTERSPLSLVLQTQARVLGIDHYQG